MPQDLDARDARTAAELQPDVNREQVGAVYAEAFLAAAEGAGQADELVAEFERLVTESLDPFPEFAAVLASALVSHEEKFLLLDRVFAGRVAPLTLNFLKVLSKHGRLDCVQAIRRPLREQYDRLRRRVRVEVTAAVPPAAESLERLTGRLREMLGIEPVLEMRIDPAVIGGLVVRVGDTVYDGSVAAQLKLVEKQMVDRSAHEIQSRRDRFRNPAGN